MFESIKTGFGEGNITGGITGIVTGIAGATNKQMADNVDKILDDFIYLFLDKVISEGVYLMYFSKK